jgi:hypothetical protein
MKYEIAPEERRALRRGPRLTLYLALSLTFAASLPGCILDLSGLTGKGGDEAESGADAGDHPGEEATDGSATGDTDTNAQASDAPVDISSDRAIGDAPADVGGLLSDAFPSDAPPSDARDEAGDAPPDVDLDAPPPCETFDTETGHCYFATGSAKWSVARDNCVRQGGHLATITSAAEQSVVANLYRLSDRWIGLYQVGTKPFQWVTGEVLGDYKNWAPPDDPNDPPDACVRLVATTGYWSDYKCTYSFTGICERDDP